MLYEIYGQLFIYTYFNIWNAWLIILKYKLDIFLIQGQPFLCTFTFLKCLINIFQIYVQYFSNALLNFKNTRSIFFSHIIYIFNAYLKYMRNIFLYTHLTFFQMFNVNFICNISIYNIWKYKRKLKRKKNVKKTKKRSWPPACLGLPILKELDARACVVSLQARHSAGLLF